MSKQSFFLTQSLPVKINIKVSIVLHVFNNVWLIFVHVGGLSRETRNMLAFIN